MEQQVSQLTMHSKDSQTFHKRFKNEARKIAFMIQNTDYQLIIFSNKRFKNVSKTQIPLLTSKILESKLQTAKIRTIWHKNTHPIRLHIRNVQTKFK